jgi:hypothetical protein
MAPLLVISLNLGGAQEIRSDEKILLFEKTVPSSARGSIYSMSKLKIYTGIRPVFFYADFDGDGKSDLAVWVTNEKGERGLWVHLSSQKQPIILGCGYINNPWRDWRFDEWTLLRKWQPINESVPLRDSPPAPHPMGDYLLLGMKESSAAVQYWDGKAFKIYTGE